MYISMKLITDIAPRIREVNRIIAGCSSGTMPFEQAFMLARFYYDFQDTNSIIAEAEPMAADELDGLRNVAVSLKAGTATLLNNISLLDGIGKHNPRHRQHGERGKPMNGSILSERIRQEIEDLRW